MSFFKPGTSLTFSNDNDEYYIRPRIRCFDQPQTDIFIICYFGFRQSHLHFVNRFNLKIIAEYVVEHGMSYYQSLRLQNGLLFASTDSRIYVSELTKTLWFKTFQSFYIPNPLGLLFDLTKKDSSETLYLCHGQAWRCQISTSGTRLTCEDNKQQNILLPPISMVPFRVPVHAFDHSCVVLTWTSSARLDCIWVQYWSQQTTFFCRVPKRYTIIEPNSLSTFFPGIVIFNRNYQRYQYRSKINGSLFKKGSLSHPSCLLPNGFLCNTINNTLYFYDVFLHSKYMVICWTKMHHMTLFDINLLKIIKSFL